MASDRQDVDLDNLFNRHNRARVDGEWDNPHPSEAIAARRTALQEAASFRPSRNQMDSISIRLANQRHFIAEYPIPDTSEHEKLAGKLVEPLSLPYIVETSEEAKNLETAGFGYVRVPPKCSLNDKPPTFGIIWKCRLGEVPRFNPDIMAPQTVRAFRPVPPRYPGTLDGSLSATMRPIVSLDLDEPPLPVIEEQPGQVFEEAEPECANRHVPADQILPIYEYGPRTKEQIEEREQFEQRFGNEMSEAFVKDLQPGIGNPLDFRHAKPGKWNEFNPPIEIVGPKRPEEELAPGAICTPHRPKDPGPRFLPPPRLRSPGSLAKEERDKTRERHVFDWVSHMARVQREKRARERGEIPGTKPDELHAYMCRARKYGGLPEKGPALPDFHEGYKKAHPAPPPEYFHPHDKENLLIRAQLRVISHLEEIHQNKYLEICFEQSCQDAIRRAYSLDPTPRLLPRSLPSLPVRNEQLRAGYTSPRQPLPVIQYEQVVSARKMRLDGLSLVVEPGPPQPLSEPAVEDKDPFLEEMSFDDVFL